MESFFQINNLRISTVLSRIKFTTIAGLLLSLLCIAPAGNRSLAAQGQTGSSGCIKRADFQMSGARCVLCLREAAWSLRQQPGVIKADVSIYNPHWAVVIYDCGKTSLAAIMRPLAKQHVFASRVNESALAGVPSVVIPLSGQNQR